jgi:fatty acid amide hydrolase
MHDSSLIGAAELARRIKAGELSSREVVEAHIRRIEETASALNAVVIPLFGRARAEAAAADATRARGEALGPLHGVPITIKEQFLVEGSATTFGLRSQIGHRAEADGPLIRRIRSAGAIVLGKTNTSQLLIYIEADNPVYGRTNNPWNPERSCGGSSGGEAAVIAAGGSPLGLGSDLGGSIREPAHFCGIHGLMPTSRRLTNLDTRGGIFTGRQDAIIPQTGPMARKIEDLCLAMDILATPGGDFNDPSIPAMPWRSPKEVKIEDLRVAYYDDDGCFPASPAIRRIVAEGARALRSLGAEIVPWTPPDVTEAMRLYFGLLTAEGSRPHRRALAGTEAAPQLKSMLTSLGMPRPVRLLTGVALKALGQERMSEILKSVGEKSAAELDRLIQARERYCLRFRKALEADRFDAILCPPAALPALLHGSSSDLNGFDSYARLYNLLGMPAGVVAAGRVRAGEESDRIPHRDSVDRAAARTEKGSAGLPVGLQVAAPWWREDIVLAVMGALENHFEGNSDYPRFGDDATNPRG